MKDLHKWKFAQKKTRDCDFVTQFQKGCISNISALGGKKRRSAGKRKIFGHIAKVFCFISVLALVLRLVLKYIYGKDTKLCSVVALFSTVISLVSVRITANEAEKEDVFSQGIDFFEDAVNFSENI